MVIPLVPTPASRPARLLLLAAQGAVVCTIGDQLHVRFGVISYPRPDVLGQAWWVPLLFLGAVLAMLTTYPVVFRALRRAFGWSSAGAVMAPAQARRATAEFFL